METSCLHHRPGSDRYIAMFMQGSIAGEIEAQKVFLQGCDLQGRYVTSLFSRNALLPRMVLRLGFAFWHHIETISASSLCIIMGWMQACHSRACGSSCHRKQKLGGNKKADLLHLGDSSCSCRHQTESSRSTSLHL